MDLIDINKIYVAIGRYKLDSIAEVIFLSSITSIFLATLAYDGQDQLSKDGARGLLSSKTPCSCG